MKKEDVGIEELMKNIYDNKIAIEAEKEQIDKNLAQVETLRKSLENEKNQQKEKQDKILDSAKKEAKKIISDAKEKANKVIRELSTLDKGNLAEANNLRNELNAELKEVSTSSNSGLNLEALKNALNNKFSLKNSSLADKEKNKNQSGNKASSQNAKIASNSLKANNGTSHSSVTFSKGNKFKAQTISSEINVIGMNVDEATFVIDKYLDDCAISKLSPVRIVHGKGTGKLREGIHKFLKTNPHVKSFRLGTFGEGEMGVTVVELK